MKTREQIIFDNLKPNISNAIKKFCPTADAILYKIADEVQHIQTVTPEPGVEIVKGLSMIIESIIESSVQSGCDLSVIAKGILIGAFRSRKSIKVEAHKTIHLLVKEVVQSAFKHKGNVKQIIDGLLSGIIVVAKENKLNVQEALIVTVEDILSSAKKINLKFTAEVNANIPKEYSGMKTRH